MMSRWPRCGFPLAAIVSVALCLSCAASQPGREMRPLQRSVVNSLIVRSTLANVTRLSRPVVWALASTVSAVPVHEVLFAVDGRNVGVSRRPPWSCCAHHASYLAGLTPGRHTFVCTVVTDDRRTARETVTVTITNALNSADK